MYDAIIIIRMIGVCALSQVRRLGPLEVVATSATHTERRAPKLLRNKSHRNMPRKGAAGGKKKPLKNASKGRKLSANHFLPVFILLLTSAFPVAIRLQAKN